MNKELDGLDLHYLSIEEIKFDRPYNEESNQNLELLIKYKEDYKEYLKDKYERNNRISNWKRICASFQRLFNR